MPDSWSSEDPDETEAHVVKSIPSLGALPSRGSLLQLAFIVILSGLAALSLLAFAKVGSAPNYALAPLLAASLFGADLLGRLMDLAGAAPSPRRRMARLGVWAMGLGLLWWAVSAYLSRSKRG